MIALSPHPANSWASQSSTLSYTIDHKALQQQWGQPALASVPTFRKLSKRKQNDGEVRGRKRSEAGKKVGFSLGTKPSSHDNELDLPLKWTQHAVYVNVKEARSQSTSSTPTNSPPENHCGTFVRVSDSIDTLPPTPPSPTTSTRSFASSGRHVSVGFHAPAPRKQSPSFKVYRSPQATHNTPLPTPPLSGVFDLGKISSRRRLFDIEEDEVPVHSRNRSKGSLRELLSEKRRESFFGQTTTSGRESRMASVARLQTKLQRTSLADSPISPPMLEAKDLPTWTTPSIPRGEPLPARVMVDTSSHASLRDPRYISYITMIHLPSFSAFVHGTEWPSASTGVPASDTPTSVQLSPTSAFPSSLDQFSPPPRRRSDGDLLRKRVLEWSMVLHGKTNGIRIRGEKEPAERKGCCLSGRERWVATFKWELVADDEEVEEGMEEGMVQAEALFAKHQFGSNRGRQPSAVLLDPGWY